MAELTAEDGGRLLAEFDEARIAGVHAVVGLVIRRGDAVLILKRRADDFLPNVWEVPGGHVEPGESPREAAARELLEETGWRLTALGRLLSRFDCKGEGGISRQWNFVVAADTGRPLIHPEHQAYRWVTRHTCRRYRMTPAMRELVELALQEPDADDGKGQIR